MQFLEEIKQSKAKPVCLLEEHVLHLQFIDEKSNSMQFSHEIAGEGHALWGDRLALLCFALIFHQEIAGDRCALWGHRLALQMRGQDLIMWIEGQWEASTNYTKRNISKDRWILRLYERIGQGPMLLKFKRSWRLCEDTAGAPAT